MTDFATTSFTSKEELLYLSLWGRGSHTLTLFANFVIVDKPMAYNTILDRPMMKAIKMVIADYCLTFKFPTPMGIGFIVKDIRDLSACEILVDEFDHREEFYKLELVWEMMLVTLYE